MTKTSTRNNSAWQISTLSASASKLVSTGQLKEAANVYEQILKAAPYHIQALDFLAMLAYEQGNMNLCLGLLERSIHANPERPITYQNLGIAYQASGKYDQALEALDHALSLQQAYPMVLLRKGHILEIMHRKPEAIQAYIMALKQLSDFPQLQDVKKLGQAGRSLISHANKVVSQHKKDRLDTVFEKLNKKYDANGLTNAKDFIDIYLGKTPAAYHHAMQRPEFLYYPGLQPRAFFERHEFEWIKTLETAATDIRAELLPLLQKPAQLQPYVQVLESHAGQWQELNNSMNWSSYHLYKCGERIVEHCLECPVTVGVLNKIPLIHTPGHSPEAFFSILHPGTHIPPHYGLTNYKITVHLPLIVPTECAIRVGDETRNWIEDQCLIFDDSYLHEAWNYSNELRAVLILEVWNPQLTDADRQAVTALLEVIRDI
jgi:predicted negative regulator of RcsB-dependent stress response